MPTGRDTVARRNVLRWVGTGSIAALAGCTGTDGDESDEEPAPEPEAVDVSEESTWRTASLTDATTDEEFRIADADRPVLVHTFSIGCAVCQSQHSQFDEFYANADVEIVDITIGSNDEPDDLRNYADEEGYDWRFGTAPGEVTGALSSDFGQEIYSSASSPIIVDCQNGSEVYTLDKIVSAEHLESILDDVCEASASGDPSDSSDTSDSGNSSGSSNASA